MPSATTGAPPSHCSLWSRRLTGVFEQVARVPRQHGGAEDQDHAAPLPGASPTSSSFLQTQCRPRVVPAGGRGQAESQEVTLLSSLFLAKSVLQRRSSATMPTALLAPHMHDTFACYDSRLTVPLATIDTLSLAGCADRPPSRAVFSVRCIIRNCSPFMSRVVGEERERRGMRVTRSVCD